MKEVWACLCGYKDDLSDPQDCPHCGDPMYPISTGWCADGKGK